MGRRPVSQVRRDDIARLMQATDVQIPAFRAVSNGRAVAVILAISAAVFGFLVWLIYVKPAAGYTSRAIGALPAVNAALNALSTGLLVAGYVEVRRRRYTRHMKLMFAALASSTLFLICYIVYHNFHGDTKFGNHGAIIRPIYFFTLITHIVLSGVAVPLILTSFYLSLAGKYALHRRVSRFTFPIWLYVSVTGVMVFAMLKLFNP
jgi:putative membrane protein